MNQNAPQPSFELPSLPGESKSAPAENQGESSLAQPEIYTVPPVSSNPSQSLDDSLSVTSGQPLPQAPAPLAPVPAADPLAIPVAADDADLIEKEWVVKAKQIVAKTKEDPYSQTREMNKFKADYLKKRYNKDLKIEES